MECSYSNLWANPYKVSEELRKALTEVREVLRKALSGFVESLRKP